MASDEPVSSRIKIVDGIPSATVLPTSELEDLCECRNIVRRLAVWHESGKLSSNVIDIARDASAVWAEMREDGK